MVGARPAMSAGKKESGGCLVRARKALGLSLEEVASELRIPPRQLAALEEGNLEVFPAEIYAKGAYQKYATYLGVDSRDHYHEFLRTLSEVRQVVPLRLPLPATWLQRVLMPYGVIGAVVVMAVVGVVSYLGWQVKWYMHLPELEIMVPVEALVEGSTLKVKGFSEEEAEVTVNGEAVAVNEDRQFEKELFLREGINVIQVEAKGVSGRTRVVTREVLKSTKPGS